MISIEKHPRFEGRKMQRFPVDQNQENGQKEGWFQEKQEERRRLSKKMKEKGGNLLFRGLGKLEGDHTKER